MLVVTVLSADERSLMGSWLAHEVFAQSPAPCKIQARCHTPATTALERQAPAGPWSPLASQPTFVVVPATERTYLSVNAKQIYLSKIPR